MLKLRLTFTTKVYKNVLILFLLFCSSFVKAQITGSITVGGDFNKFYPTVWYDGGWGVNSTAELELGRSEIHTNSSARGGVVAKFKFHANAYGNGANFINADVVQVNNQFGANVNFIAGWKDASYGNTSTSIIIWLRGGGTTYFYRSLYSTLCIIYDGVANPLPYQEQNGPAHQFKTAPDAYVNSNGTSQEGTAFYRGTGISYFAGNVGIGTATPKEALSVNGNIRAQQIKVETAGWPDFVFKPGYNLPGLSELKSFIDKNSHLPGVPSAREIKEKGQNLGEINRTLLQKIEELTLYLIEKDQELQQQAQTLKLQTQHLELQDKRLKKLESLLIN
jgi:hypothetical protein